MRQIIAWVALALAGCTASSQYGNFVPSVANQQQIATDAAQQIVTLWPPGTTRIELGQATPDAFGLALVRSLRGRGYALMEYADDQAQVSAGAASTGSPAELLLRYVLDQAHTTNLYRLTLLVGTQSLTRPYLFQNGELLPAGYWVRKE